MASYLEEDHPEMTSWYMCRCGHSRMPGGSNLFGWWWGGGGGGGTRLNFYRLSNTIKYLIALLAACRLTLSS